MFEGMTSEALGRVFTPQVINALILTSLCTIAAAVWYAEFRKALKMALTLITVALLFVAAKSLIKLVDPDAFGPAAAATPSPSPTPSPTPIPRITEPPLRGQRKGSAVASPSPTPSPTPTPTPSPTPLPTPAPAGTPLVACPTPHGQTIQLPPPAPAKEAVAPSPTPAPAKNSPAVVKREYEEDENPVRH